MKKVGKVYLVGGGPGDLLPAGSGIHDQLGDPSGIPEQDEGDLSQLPCSMHPALHLYFLAKMSPDLGQHRPHLHSSIERITSSSVSQHNSAASRRV